MTPVQPGVDPRSLDQLAIEARSSPSPQTQQAVARQFEAVFADMMIHSMRLAHLGSDMLGSGGKLYQSLYDWQVAEDMTRGRGLGIASMLMRQMHGPASATAPSKTTLRAPDASDRLAGTSFPLGAAAGEAPAASLHAIDATDRFDGPDPAAPAATAAAATPAGAPRTTASASSTTSLTADVVGFVDRLWPQAQSVARALGVSVRAVIAQAALETGWGEHESAPHNLFGIKATGSQAGAEDPTTEYADGTPTQTVAKFRRFASDTAAMASYASLIRTDPRYQAALGSGDNVRRFATALQQAGYATDPAYAEKLIAVANDPRLLTALNAVAATQAE